MQRLEEVRRSFEATGDVTGETSLLLHLGHLARADDDIASLGRILQRGEELAELGQPTAAALVALGRAVAAQMSGDPSAALVALDGVPPGSLVGDWAAQALMIRGTNLLLCGRTRAAVSALESATGEGSEASQAVAFDLLATARWYAEDPLGALGDAETAESLATRADVPGLVHRIRATRACFLAASGQSDPARQLLDGVVPRGDRPTPTRRPGCAASWRPSCSPTPGTSRASPRPSTGSSSPVGRCVPRPGRWP